LTPDEPERFFREPWEARAFALVVRLHEAGYFTWAEWVAAISAEITAAQAAGDPDLGDTYYSHWLAALEKIVVSKGLTDEVDILLRTIEVSTKPEHVHPARRAPIRIA
jgi:nitrile hydratase accessory protein